MIEFIISFLIIFPLDLEKIEECTKQRDSILKPKKSPKKSDRKANKGKVNVNDKATDDIDPNFIVSCPTVKKACFIDYNLCNKKSTSYKISVVYWGQIAKVYTQTESKPIKCIIHNGFAWVPFSVMHRLNIKNVTELWKLKTYDIVFRVGEETKMLHPKAKSDGPQLYYNFESDEDSNVENIYSTVVPTQLNKIPQKPDENRSYEKYAAKSPKKSGLLSYLFKIPHQIHQKRVWNVIKQKEIKVPNVIPKKTDGRKKKKNKIDGTITSQANKENEKTNLVITGDQLFFEHPFWFVEETNVSSNVLYFGLWLSAKDLMDETQRKQIKPFGIFLKRISNLPADIMLSYGMTDIVIECVYDNIFAEIELPVTPVTNFSKLPIGVVRSIFIGKLDHRRVIESVQTKKLTIKVYGLKAVKRKGPNKVEERGTIFGKADDDLISNRIQNRAVPDVSPPVPVPEPPLKSEGKHKKTQKNTDKSVKGKEEQEKEEDYGGREKVLLGLAFVDCSSFMLGEFVIDAVVPLTSDTLNNPIGNPNASMGRTLYNIPNIHHEKEIKTDCIIRNKEFVERNTELRVIVKLGSTLRTNVLAKAASVRSNYSRAIVVCRDRRLAARILQRVLRLNAQILGEDNVRLPFTPHVDVAKEDLTSKRKKTKTTPHESLVTGFTVDSIDMSVLMFEGLATVAMPFVLSNLISVQPEDGRVLYDSDLLFTERYYKDFIKYGGIYVITLSQTFRSLLTKQRLYIEGNMPYPARRALLSLDLLKESATIKSVCLQHLLPTCKELLSLNIEFGIPISTY